MRGRVRAPLGGDQRGFPLYGVGQSCLLKSIPIAALLPAEYLCNPYNTEMVVKMMIVFPLISHHHTFSYPPLAVMSGASLHFIHRRRCGHHNEVSKKELHAHVRTSHSNVPCCFREISLNAHSLPTSNIKVFHTLPLKKRTSHVYLNTSTTPPPAPLLPPPRYLS